jgi:hypothetical protein
MPINDTNPLTAAQNAAREATALAYPHEAIVVSAPKKESEQPAHVVRVAGVTFNGQKDASVVTPIEGDANIPPEGSRVLVSFVRGEKPVVVGQLYSQGNGSREFSNSAPPYNESRRLGHKHSTGYIEFRTEKPTGEKVRQKETDGKKIIHVESDDDSVVDIAEGFYIEAKKGATVDISDGIYIEAADGTTVDVDPTDGTVRVNDATQGVVIDVEAADRNEYDGITELDIIRSSDLFAE